MKCCPECGTPSPTYDTRDLPYTYKGRTTIIRAVVGHFCAYCGEVTLDRDTGDRYGDSIDAFQREVDAHVSVSE